MLLLNNPQFANLLAQVPTRHPAQLYEAFVIYLFSLSYFSCIGKQARQKSGLLFGLFWCYYFQYGSLLNLLKKVKEVLKALGLLGSG
jgi:prolipoprotein diacylglyceryltransferase